MYKIYLIIFVFQYIHADDNDESNEKYIDLLPEEEKQEFLNRIARRILEGVNSSDVPNESYAEVNEEQLDAQNDFVNKIIKEESINIQTTRRDLSKEQDADKKTDRDSDNERHIDLTRARREDTKDSEVNEHLYTTSELKVIPVKIYQDNLNDSHGNSVIIPESNRDVETVSNTGNTTEYGKVIKTDLIKTNDSKNTENIKVIRKSFDDQLLFRTTMSNFEPNSDENSDSDSTSRPANSEIANTTETDDEIIWISTQKIYDSENDSSEYINSNSSETISASVSTTLTNGEQITTSVITNLTLEPEKINEEITSLKTPYNSSYSDNASYKNISNKHLHVRLGDDHSEDVTNVTQVRHNDLSELKKNESNIDTVKVHNTISETNTSNNTKRPPSETRSIYLVNNSKGNLTDAKINSSQTSPRARDGLQEATRGTSLQKSDLNAKEYEVFEVVADKPQFVKSNVKVKDTPYYVPVYNYAPNYAHFRPHSRFGPDTATENEDIKHNYESYKNSNEKEIDKFYSDKPIIRNMFTGYNKKDTFYGNKPEKYIIKKKNVFDLQQPIKINNFQNIYYNPNDYLDVDYYFGRSNTNYLRQGNNDIVHNQQLPDSDDEDHPYQSIHKSNSVKDHVRAVRKILYLKQIFENIPAVKKRELRKFYNHLRKQKGDTKYNHRDILRDNSEDSISMDYYFGLLPNIEPGQVIRNKSKKQRLLRNSQEIIEANENKIHKIELKSNKSDIIGSLLAVLQDFIRFDNEALLRYNWLGTAVDILAGIKKLLDLTKQLQFGDHIHPKDLELLKYTIYLYKSSLDSLKGSSKPDVNLKEEEIVVRKKGLLPKNKWNNRIRDPLKLWNKVANFIRNKKVKQERLKLLYDFEEFLQSVTFFLRNFHDAIKHISMITKYDNQKWYEDLKNIYFNGASDEELLKLVLHVGATKLLSCIEESASQGVEDNFKNYVVKNKQNVARCKEDFMFILNILQELKRLNNNKL